MKLGRNILLVMLLNILNGFLIKLPNSQALFVHLEASTYCRFSQYPSKNICVRFEFLPCSMDRYLNRDHPFPDKKDTICPVILSFPLGSSPRGQAQAVKQVNIYIQQITNYKIHSYFLTLVMLEPNMGEPIPWDQGYCGST